MPAVDEEEAFSYEREKDEAERDRHEGRQHSGKAFLFSGKLSKKEKLLNYHEKL